MKTATITWLKHNNFGTQLQAYALQQSILKLGIDNEIFYDDFALKTKSAVNENVISNKHDLKYSIIYHIKRLIRAIMLIFSKKRRIQRKKNIELDKRIAKHECIIESAFSEFKNKHLKIKYISGYNELNNICKNYDAFIAGSDQTWSPLVYNPYYYITFTDIKKISYAASIGITHIPEDLVSDIRSNIASYHNISVREESAKNALQPLYNKEISVVLDPTLLLRNDEWSKLAVLPDTKNYILCYFLETNNWYYEYALKMSKILNKKIILIPNRIEHLSYEFSNIKYPGPAEFVGLIKNADLIITDSYHGFIFSTIFEKSYVLIKRFEDNSPKNQNSRIFNLLNILNLQNVFISEKEADLADICSPDYSSIKKIIDEKIQFSMNYLKGALGII